MATATALGVAGAAASASSSAAPTIMKVPKYSLLPPGIYRVRVSGIKLFWGMNEECPASASLLFPVPHEVYIFLALLLAGSIFMVAVVVVVIGCRW